MSPAVRTGLVLLFGLVVAILVGPGLIDWNRYKPLIETRIEEALGRDVMLGEIDFGLLPAPSLSVGDLSVANADGHFSPALIALRKLEARVALWPLLLGRIEIETVKLTEPVLSLERLPDGRLNADGIPAKRAHKPRAAHADMTPRFGIWRFGPDAISINAIRVLRGTLSYRDQRLGWVEEATGVQGIFSARTLDGPFALKAKLLWRGNPLALSVNLAAPDVAKGRPLDIKLTAPDLQLRASLDGRQDSAGAFRGTLSLRADEPSRLWRAGEEAAGRSSESLILNAALSTETDTYALNDIKLSWGEFQAQGEGGARFAETPELSLSLRGSTLDLDRLSPPHADPAVPWPLGFLAPPNLAAEGSASHATAPAARGVFAIWRGKLGLQVDKIVYRQGMIRSLQVEAVLAPSAVDNLVIKASLPGETQLALGGRLDIAPAASAFDGGMTLEGEHARAFLAWSGVPVSKAPSAHLEAFSYRGGLRMRPQEIVLSDFESALDGGNARGSIRLLSAPRLRVDAVLDATRLNVDAYRPLLLSMLPPAAPNATMLDRTLAVLARSEGTLKLKANSVKLFGAALDRAHADITLLSGTFAVNWLEAADVGGGRLTLQGRMENLATATQTTLALRLEANDGRRALAALGMGAAQDPPMGEAPQPLSVTLDAQGPRIGVVLSQLNVALGQQKLEGSGRFNFAQPQPRLELALRGNALNLTPFALPPAEGAPPARWSSEPFALQWLGDIDGQASLDADSLSIAGVSFSRPHVEATLKDGLLELRAMRGEFLSGNLSANANIRGGSALPGFGLSVKFMGANGGALSTLLWGAPMIEGRLDGDVSLAGQGENEIAVARGLTGQLALNGSKGTLSGFDLVSFRKRTNAPLGHDAIKAAMSEFKSGTTPYKTLSLKGAIKEGALKFSAGAIGLEGATARFEGGLDFSARTLDTRLLVPALLAADAPPAVLRMSGPLAAPQITRDTRKLAAYLERRTKALEKPSAAANVR